jgi:hypothetical protein
VAKQFLESIDPNNLIIGQIGKRIQENTTTHASAADGRTAFMFSQTGVRKLNIDEEGIECKDSLKEPRNVARLLLQIVVALEGEEIKRNGNNNNPSHQEVAVKGDDTLVGEKEWDGEFIMDYGLEISAKVGLQQ